MLKTILFLNQCYQNADFNITAAKPYRSTSILVANHVSEHIRDMLYLD